MTTRVLHDKQTSKTSLTCLVMQTKVGTAIWVCEPQHIRLLFQEQKTSPISLFNYDGKFCSLGVTVPLERKEKRNEEVNWNDHTLQGLITQRTHRICMHSLWLKISEEWLTEWVTECLMWGRTGGGHLREWSSQGSTDELIGLEGCCLINRITRGRLNDHEKFRVLLFEMFFSRGCARDWFSFCVSLFLSPSSISRYTFTRKLLRLPWKERRSNILKKTEPKQISSFEQSSCSDTTRSVLDSNTTNATSFLHSMTWIEWLGSNPLQLDVSIVFFSVEIFVHHSSQH